MIKKIFVAGLSIAIVASSLVGVPGGTVEAAVSDWKQGATIIPTSQGDLGSEATMRSLEDLKNTGANNVAFAVTYHQTNTGSPDLFRGWNTPSDESLITAINKAHELGLAVALKIRPEVQTGEWRANINPQGAARDQWYANYQSILEHYARLGNDHGVEMISIGTEIIHMATATSDANNTGRWYGIIGVLRGLYSGSLTYGANWGGSYFASEAEHIEFWPALDYIGLSAYYPLDSGSDGVEDIRSKWPFWNDTKIKPLYDRFGKPILFTEAGYRSLDNARFYPWEWGIGGGVDENEQANLYEALFSYWNNHSYIHGVFIWEWQSNPDAGGPGSNSYTPQNKRAEEVMRQWFSGGGSPTPEPPPAGSFSASASVSPASPSSGTTVNVTARLTSNAAAQQRIIDLEIYNAQGEKVAQRFFENQAFVSGETKEYRLTFIPSAQGAYTVKAGVFGPGWSSIQYWADTLATVGVSGGTTVPPDTSGDLEVWWPTDGAVVSGVQPFKAMLENRSVDTYQMFWQVDGDRLNEMYSSFEGYPHKEAWVDLSGWTWRGNGPYRITFVAKDSTATIGERSVNITVF